jgi:hypothetical protein|tara:strand:+ start:482 stop:850 length:369 start_codon:yes stop_codon:yes gene_type:complete
MSVKKQNMAKRSRDGTVTMMRSEKRPRLTPTRKRTADFDDEVEHIRKRLKATTPTAEEAMAFLLPHLLHLRRLYIETLNDNKTLQQHNLILSTTCTKVAHQSAQLRRELDMSKYRLTLVLGK